MSLLDAITAGAQGIAFLHDSAETVIKCSDLRCAAFADMHFCHPSLLFLFAYESPENHS